VSLATANLTYSPWGKQSAVWRLAAGLVPSSEETVLPTYMCLDCLACREACDHDMDVPGNLAGARVRQTRAHAPLTAASTAFFDAEAAWRLLRETAPAWRRVDECQALFIPGPEMLGEHAADLLAAVFRTLDNVGDKVTGVNRDSVLECGHHLYAHARFDEARKAARLAHKRFGRYSRLVFGSPHCASFVKLQWPLAHLDRSRQLTTLLEFVGRRLDFAVNPGFFRRRLAYHDPCHLGRHLGLYQLPRDILKWAANRKPIELLYSHNRALCCGGGYPLVTVAPEVARDAARAVLDLLSDSQAQVLVTSCAQCRRQLKEADPQAEILHLVEVLAEMKA